MLYDVFVSHASEDKELVRALVRALETANVAVWYDESELRLGDSLRQSIDRGLSKSRHGVVILSRAFFAKRWPQWELNGLAARHMSGEERVILPVWHGIDNRDILAFSPSLADLVAVSTDLGVPAVCQAIVRIVRPQESPIVVARDELIAYGHTPPVISDEWWLDVVEASNRLLNAGVVVPEESQWGRWSFPLPNRGARGEGRGVRLAWVAMQLWWAREADERNISQITRPSSVHAFIEEMPGLADVCRTFPGWLAAYAPQLTIPGLGREFEPLFDEARAASRSMHDELMFRLPLEQLDPASAACQFVQGSLTGPSPKRYETFDYLIWLLSADSQWLPEPYRLLLRQGMREWPVWLAPYRSDQRGDRERVRQWVNQVDVEAACSPPADAIAHLRREVAFSANQLDLADDVDTLLADFLSGGFLEAYVRDRRSTRGRGRTTAIEAWGHGSFPTFDGVAVYCADIGSAAAGRFGWASTGPDGTASGADMRQLVASVADDLRAGRPVALGFECPLFVPLALEPEALTSARGGEGNRPWSASAGACALTTGLVQVAWILREVRRLAPPESQATLEWDDFSRGRASLLLWEAFVCGASKRGGHVADAQAATDAFRERLLASALTSDVGAGLEAYSLIGAALLRSGWSNDPKLLQHACVVVRVAPHEESSQPRKDAM
jgi:hypothetical protein